MGFNYIYYSFSRIVFVLQLNLFIFNRKLFYHPYMFYRTFGVLWLISFIYLYSKKIENPFLKNSIILIPFIFLLGFLSVNYSRIFFIGFPIIIPISLYLLKNPLQRKYLILILIITLILLIIQIIGAFYYFGNKFKIIVPDLISDIRSFIFYLLLICLFTIFLMLILIFLIFKDLKVRNSEENEISLS